MRSSIARTIATLFVSLLIPVAASAAGSTYIVQSGDTLSSIAAAHHTSVSTIVTLNHLSNADFLRQGQVLRLTAATPHPSHRIAQSAKRGHATTFAIANKKKMHTAHRHAIAARDAGGVQIRERQALWAAMHSGFSSPDFASLPSFATAQRAIALELRLTRTALRYLGVPYAWGGESFSGVDCSGFVQAVFRHNGIELPRTADEQFEIGRHVGMSGLQPGDLVFFETYSEGASHVGIYLGQGQFVHASSSNGVRVDSLSEGYYASRYIGARRAAI